MISDLSRYEINEIRSNLRAWYNRPLGRTLLEMERQKISEVLSGLFGYHIAQIGCLLGSDMLNGSLIPHKVLIDPDATTNYLNSTIFAYPDAIPLASDSTDVVVLPHVLEFERDPHQILREVDRILIPEGHVVVLGFNPWSSWGAKRLINRANMAPPWCGDFLTLARIKDWAALLGFDVVSIQRYFYRPPFKYQSVLNKSAFMESLGVRFWPALAGAYLLVAKKRVATMTPIKPSWRSREKIVGGLASPSARSRSNRNNV